MYGTTVYARFPNVVFAREDSGIGSVADLRASDGSRSLRILLVMLQALLASAGLTTDDVEVVTYPDFGQGVAVAEGQVDAAAGFANNEPVQLEVAGIPVVLLRIDDVAPLPVRGSRWVRDAGAKGDAVRAFQAATLRAMEDIVADPEVGVRAAVEWLPELGMTRQRWPRSARCSRPRWIHGRATTPTRTGWSRRPRGWESAISSWPDSPKRRLRRADRRGCHRARVRVTLPVRRLIPDTTVMATQTHGHPDATETDAHGEGGDTTRERMATTMTPRGTTRVTDTARSVGRAARSRSTGEHGRRRIGLGRAGGRRDPSAPTSRQGLEALEQPHDPAGGVDVDALAVGVRRQPGHRAHVAAVGGHEAGAREEPGVADGQRKPVGRPLSAGSWLSDDWVLAMHTGSGRTRAARSSSGRSASPVVDAVRAVDAGGDTPRSAREASRSAVRNRKSGAPFCAAAQTARASSSAPAPPSEKWTSDDASSRARGERDLAHDRDLRCVVGREGVDRDDRRARRNRGRSRCAGEVRGSRDRLGVLLERRSSGLPATTAPTPPCIFSARIVATITPQPDAGPTGGT